jgi:hypothetical protein
MCEDENNNIVRKEICMPQEVVMPEKMPRAILPNRISISVRGKTNKFSKVRLYFSSRIVSVLIKSGVKNEGNRTINGRFKSSIRSVSMSSETLLGKFLTTSSSAFLSRSGSTCSGLKIFGKRKKDVINTNAGIEKIILNLR